MEAETAAELRQQVFIYTLFFFSFFHSIRSTGPLKYLTFASLTSQAECVGCATFLKSVNGQLMARRRWKCGCCPAAAAGQVGFTLYLFFILAFFLDCHE